MSNNSCAIRAIFLFKKMHINFCILILCLFKMASTSCLFENHHNTRLNVQVTGLLDTIHVCSATQCKIICTDKFGFECFGFNLKSDPQSADFICELIKQGQNFEEDDLQKDRDSTFMKHLGKLLFKSIKNMHRNPFK